MTKSTWVVVLEMLRNTLIHHQNNLYLFINSKDGSEDVSRKLGLTNLRISQLLSVLSDMAKERGVLKAADGHISTNAHSSPEERTLWGLLLDTDCDWAKPKLWDIDDPRDDVDRDQRQEVIITGEQNNLINFPSGWSHTNPPFQPIPFPTEKNTPTTSIWVKVTFSGGSMDLELEHKHLQEVMAAMAAIMEVRDGVGEQ